MHPTLKTLITITIVLLTTHIYAQQSALDKVVDCEFKGKSLGALLNYLDKEHQVRFAYASESINDIAITNNYKSQTVSDILQDVLDQADINFKMYNETVMLRKNTHAQVPEQTESYLASIHLKGRITDKLSSLNLAAATVAISDSPIGTYSDEDGHFDIEIPSEYIDHEIVIQYLGYEPQRFKIKELSDAFLMVPLNISDFGIDEIIIVNRDLPIKFGSEESIKLTTEMLNSQTSSFAGSDIARNTQLLPGIDATDDTSADIKIRGSHSDETLMILDGIPVYNASHYYGIFSSINSNYVESVSLYKNIFPIQYGGKTGGVVEMLSDTSITKKLELTADINLLTTSVNLAVPISDQSSFLLSGRTSLGNISNTKFNSFTSNTPEPIETQNFTDGSANLEADPNFKFYDVNAKYQLALNNKTRLALNFYTSNDAFEINSELEGKREPDDQINFNTEAEEQWNNLGLSAILNTKLKPDLDLDASFFYSKYENENRTDLNIKRDKSRNKEQEFGASQENLIRDVGLNIKLSKQFNLNTFSLGIDAIQHNVDYNFRENRTDNLAGEDTVHEITPYANLKLQLSEKLKLSAGARTAYYEGTEKFYFSPRLLLRYNLSEKLSIKGAFSHYQQFIRELDYEYRGQAYGLWVSADRNNIPVISSSNFMVGGSARIGNFLFDIEAFYKDMDGMIEYDAVNPTGMPGDDPPGRNRQQPDENNDRSLMSGYDLYTGVGRARGVDFLVSANFNRLDSYLCYTLSKTEHSFDEILDGKFFASENDRTHQLKWINEYHIGNISFGVNGIFSSGRFYTNLRAFGNFENIRSLSDEERLSRLPSYQRLDLSAAYRLNVGSHNASFGVSLFNALNHQNVKYSQLVESRGDNDTTPLNTIVGTTANLLNRTFNLSFRLDIN